MISNHNWIGAFDHRISAAVVLFVLMLLLNTGARRKPFALRALGVLLAMAGASWVFRSFSDAWLTDVRLQGLACSAQIMTLHLLLVGGSFFCYKTNRAEAWYNGLLGLTILKAAWNTFKTGSSLTMMNGIEAPWGRYSIAGSLVSYAVYFSMVLVLYFIYVKLVAEPPYHAPAYLMVQLTVVFVSLQMVLEYCGHVFTAQRDAEFLYYLCALLYTLLNYAAMLMIAQLDSFRHENRTMHDFISNRMHYYEMSREGITALQTACHDLKHQIRAIRTEADEFGFRAYLDELEDAVSEYSTVIESGNPTVDVVLTEKNMLCCTAKVKFTYMIDGSLFGFLTERETYSLFGNALDNALEAVTKVENPEQRIITLKGNTRGGMVVLQVENTYAGEMHLSGDVLPRTTKTGSGHGFGLRSISRIAEKYGGTMSLRTEGDVFKLTVVMHPGKA